MVDADFIPSTNLIDELKKVNAVDACSQGSARVFKKNIEFSVNLSYRGFKRLIYTFVNKR